ncbi:MAG: iron transporter [Firmicutes bacterium]|nr:iron transporter [Bacillota bacterium]
MKFKKVSAIVAATVMATTALTACSNAKTESSTQSTVAQAPAEEAPTEAAKADAKAADTAAAPGDAGFTEVPIGDEQESKEAHINVAAVYFQAVDMIPADQMPASEADIHLEADISTIDDYYGFGLGAWVPYLTVDYDVIDKDGASVASGSFMPMNADDGPHYGDNIKMPGEGTYTLKLTIHSPAENGYLLHSDSETGVEAGKDGTGLWKDPVVLEYDWDYVPLAK